MTQPQQVAIAPVITVVNLGQTRLPDGSGAVVMEVSVPSGSTVVFLDPDSAEDIGKKLQMQARMARVGIVIPQPNIDTNGRKLGAPKEEL